MIPEGTRVKVRWDDSNPHLNGKSGVVVRGSDGRNPPNWVNVEIEGEVYPLRGDELQILKEGE